MSYSLPKRDKKHMIKLGFVIQIQVLNKFLSHKVPSVHTNNITINLTFIVSRLGFTIES